MKSIVILFDRMFFTFYCNQFSLILVMGFNIYLYFTMEKVVITSLLRLFTVSKILLEN